MLSASGAELPGCPDGFMQVRPFELPSFRRSLKLPLKRNDELILNSLRSQLSELGRPFTGGSWCGTAGGVQQYFSETSTVTASVKVN